MNDATPAKRHCSVCGGPIAKNNMIGICRKTAPCRRARMDHFQRTHGIGTKPNTTEPAEVTRKRITIAAGEVFGRWTTLEDSIPGIPRVHCRCECGTEQDVDSYSLRRGTSRSCGCGRRRDGTQPPKQSWKRRRGGAPYVAAGQVLWHLTALEDAMFSAAHILWRCACGTEVKKNARMVKNGNTKSCGCVRRAKRTTHGLSKHPLYGIWHGIMQRTLNPRCKNYPDYGARGITICERWRDPAVFIADIERLLGPRPAGYSLNRIDNDGNYEPGNVEWAPPEVQTRNRRKVRELERENAKLRARIAELESRLF